MVEGLTVYVVTALLMFIYMIRTTEDNDILDIVHFAVGAMLYPATLIAGAIHGDD